MKKRPDDDDDGEEKQKFSDFISRFFYFCFLSLSFCNRLHSRLRPYHADEYNAGALVLAGESAPARIDVKLLPRLLFVLI
jgi:hypothetical protein